MRSNDSPKEQLQDAIERLRRDFAARNPASRSAALAAQSVLPGGNTRSVLFYEPFPLTMVTGQGAEVTDVDGHTYFDFVGEFSAGLYGHSDPSIREAIVEALNGGIVLAAPNGYEVRLAQAIKERFASLELLRFCNSGTEANILAIVTALHFTKRRKVMVFDGAYHGGVLVFANGGSPINLPFEFVVAPYNDSEAASLLIRQNATELAAVIVEPILGAAGNIPGRREFLQLLRSETEAAGSLLIFDEVKTSRCGAGGMQGQVAVRPDLTTLGKYIGGGLPTGVFGGRADIMEAYNPYKAGALRHAGTFNNNVCTMAAGLVGLTKVFTPERADSFHQESEALRQGLQAQVDSRGIPLQFCGHGSLFTMHLGRKELQRAEQVTTLSRQVGQLFHIYGLLNGVAIAGRGDFYQSLPMTNVHRKQALQVVAAFVSEFGDLIADVADENANLAA